MKKKIFITTIVCCMMFCGYSQSTTTEQQQVKQISDLTQLKRNQFSKEMRQNIVSTFYTSAPQEWSKEQILLAGYLKIQELKDTLIKVKYSDELSFSLRFQTMLALSRMDDKNTTEELFLMLASKETNDQTVYALYNDIVYTRQKILFDFLIERMQDKSKNCFSANPDNPQKIECAYRIVELLAPVIRDFPQRGNMSSYKKYLEKARKWCKKQNGKYQIIDNSF
ncbi:MAG: hypothetical protein LBR45_00015 [Bacteroidales bacterium]|jgi:hypothetical protein|nr:hypothetical protein [Bacteroidales bacterium]